MIANFVYKAYKEVILIFNNSFATPVFFICALI